MSDTAVRRQTFAEALAEAIYAVSQAHDWEHTVEKVVEGEH